MYMWSSSPQPGGFNPRDEGLPLSRRHAAGIRIESDRIRRRSPALLSPTASPPKTRAPAAIALAACTRHARTDGRAPRNPCATDVLKPPEMLRAASAEANIHGDDYWPPPRAHLHVVVVDVLSLHNLPKRGERRPRWKKCHQYASAELSGTAAPPHNQDLSSPSLSFSIYAVGGERN
eukprot:2602840-Prymnesium_polylepis.1